MPHKDRARIRERPASSPATVLPYTALLDVLATRVGQPSPPRVPTLVASTSPVLPPTPPRSSALAGLGTGLAAQSVIAMYQKRGSWRKAAFWLKIPLAELREWAQAHTNDLAILGSAAIAELLHRQHVPRVPQGPRALARVHTVPPPAAPPSPLQRSTHWSGLNLSRETQETLTLHSQKVGKAGPEYFCDIFDASVLQNTADDIGIGSGVLEALIKAAGGLLVNNSVFEVLRVRRGSRTLADYLEESYDAGRIDTIARELSVSTNQYMQLIHCLCPHLLHGAIA